MKILLSLLLIVSTNFAQASYMATHCSNSHGSVTWEEGHNSNSIKITTYRRGNAETEVLPLRDVKVTFLKQQTIREENIDECGYVAHTRVYVGQVVIRPAQRNSRVLDFWSTENKVETDVICTFHVNSPRHCPELIK
jgi:hypothetical protein